MHRVTMQDLVDDPNKHELSNEILSSIDGQMGIDPPEKDAVNVDQQQ